MTAIYLMGDSAKELNADQLHGRVRLSSKSVRVLVKRLGEGVRAGPFGKKLNSLLEAEGVNVVGRGPGKRGLRAKLRRGALCVGEGKGAVDQVSWID